MTDMLLPLDDFRRIMGFHPWHFWGLASTTANGLVPVTSACNDILHEYAWQATDAAGREEIRQAIATAEQRLRQWLNYSVAPEFVAETVPFPRYFNQLESRLAAVEPPWHRAGVKASRGQIRKVGAETLDLIDAAAAVTFSDLDTDTLDETFTLAAATTVTDPDEIAVYFAATERFDGSAASERWRVRPVTISIAGGTVTITGPAWLLVRPVLYQGVSSAPIDPTGAANFASTLDVYRRWCDPNGETVDDAQAVLIWETIPRHGVWCCCSSCCADTDPVDSAFDPAAEAWAIARAGVRDAAAGVLTPGEAIRNALTGIWSEQALSICREPDRVRFRYLAGKALVGGQVDPTMQVVVARMAAAELGRKVCGCDQANRELYRWQFDRALSSGANDETYGVAEEDLLNPFGTRLGHVFAWREVQRLALIRGIAV